MHFGFHGVYGVGVAFECGGSVAAYEFDEGLMSLDKLFLVVY